MSVTDGQHKVPIAIQRPAPSRLLAGGDWAAEQGSRRPGPLRPQGPRPSAPRSQSEGQRPAARRGGAGRGHPWPRGPKGRAAEADTWITLLQAPGVGWRREEGVEAANAQNLFPSPLSLRRQSYKLIWSKKKIIKKTYKITIEKVILLGEAPLRLRGAFVLFLNAVSLPPREYRLLAKTLAASWGSRPGGWGHGSGRGSRVLRAPGTQGTSLG